ncbi:MAG TPA: SGNH/GDSL hydrolase family protein [Vicinamibacterales bacterium]|nr:SGNH/GDSL hydrolase family protein [Vicinamibacterales bacterium]
MVPPTFSEKMRIGMRLPIDSSPSLRELPAGRSLVLTAMATLLAAADWLPENPYVDPDHLEFLLTVALGALAIALALRDRLDAAATARWRNRALLAFFTIAVSLAIAEPATRWVFRDVTTSSDNGGYFTRRWFQSGVVHENSSGFREREFNAVKPAGTYRIVVVGDSFTWGNGVRQQDRYSDLLQARLPQHIEVLNFGASGANTPEHRTMVEHLLGTVNPDFVLLQWYVNDVEDDDSVHRPTFHSLMPIRGLHNWLNDVSALYTVANMQWAHTQVALGMTRSYETYLKDRLGDPNSHDSQIDRAELLDLIARCRRAGVPLGIVLFPDTAVALGEQYPFGYLHERVLDICRAQDLTCIDLRSDFALVKDHRLLWANRLDHHPSALANEIAAERMLETYSKQWAAPPPGNAAH